MYVLLFVLWVVAAAAVFGFLDTFNTGLSTKIIRPVLYRLIFYQEAKPVLKETISLLQSFNYTVADEITLTTKDITWKVKVEDVGSYLNVNKLSEEELRFLLERCGVEKGTKQDTIVDSFFDWIDNDSNRRLNGAEKDYYRQLPNPYEPRNGPILDTAELLYIKGIEPKLYQCIIQVVSSYGTGKININSATEEQLYLLGFSEDDIKNIVEELEKHPIRNFEELNFIVPRADRLFLKSHLSFGPSGVYRIKIYRNGRILGCFVVNTKHNRIVRYE